MSEPSKNPQVLLIDQNALRRAGLLSLLESWAQSAGVSVKAVTPDAAAADLEKLPRCQLVLLNLGSQSIEEEDTRCLMELLRQLIPDTPLAVVSDSTDVREIILAFRAGASGFIPTSLKPSVVLDAFTFIIRGGTYFPPTALSNEPEHRQVEIEPGSGRFGDGEAELEEHVTCTPCKQNGDSRSRIVRLTARQHEVLEQLRDGKSNKVIARDLNMTESTVKVHVRQIMRKLGAANRTQAAIRAVEADLNGAQRTNGNGIKRKHGPHRQHDLHTTIGGSA